MRIKRLLDVFSFRKKSAIPQNVVDERLALIKQTEFLKKKYEKLTKQCTEEDKEHELCKKGKEWSSIVFLDRSTDKIEEMKNLANLDWLLCSLNESDSDSLSLFEDNLKERSFYTITVTRCDPYEGNDN